MNRRTACLLISSTPALAADLLSRMAGEPARPWIGPDFWSNPLQDWRFRDRRMECAVSGADRHVYVLTRELSSRPGNATLQVRLGRLEEDTAPLDEGFAGFRIGIQGHFHDYRDSAVYGLGLNAGILHDGRLFIGDPDPSAAPVAGFPREVQLTLELTPAGPAYDARLTARDPHGKVLGTASRAALDPASVQGGIAVVCSHGPHDVAQREADRRVTPDGLVMPRRARGGHWRFWFRDLEISGGKIDLHPQRAFGPILWAMYTTTGGVLKLTAQMAPVGDRSEPVHLQVRRNGRWRTLASSPIDPLSRTATFRVANWSSSADTPYRVSYRMDGDHSLDGVIRRDPVDAPKITTAVLSCLNDFGFPHTDLLAAIRTRKPDLAAFEGDQIYERVAGYGIERLPLERAALDYLRKWYLFGWAFRDVMRDTPTVCMADDHDVFHGNVWGAGGKHADGTGQPGQDSGGYLEPAAWVNMVQRTQTSHLPDPYDPTPVLQGIGVYYTELRIGGVSFAVLEDRKWKSAPKVALPAARIVNGWAQNPDYHAPRDGDAPGADLLGPRQLKFLDAWAQDWRGGVWIKAVLSQTLFANVATMPPPANTDAVDPTLPIMKPGEYAAGDMLVADHDSNGWPQSGRNAALRAWRRCSAVHLCGDQHLSSTVQYGVDEFNDAAYALCSPAMSNVFPRRWFPPHPGANPHPHSPRNTGEYLDGFGNKVTVHAVFNPQQSGPAPDPLMDRSPGIAFAEFERATRAITLTVWPRRDSTQPASGWPVRIHQLDNGWSRAKYALPQVSAEGRRDFCVQVRREPSNEILYTLRIQGDRFTPPVDRPGTYSVRVFDPDANFESIHQSLAARDSQG
ncbi:MAG: alkaline phosphatase D family protein [Acidobacteria bacterium]|nr:alkaline phosphatase D family protein [Acidobacteriota bacterium]